MALVLFCACKKYVTGVNGGLKTTVSRASAYPLVCLHMGAAGWTAFLFGPKSPPSPPRGVPKRRHRNSHRPLYKILVTVLAISRTRL